MALCWGGSPGPLPSGWGGARTPGASQPAQGAARPPGRPQAWLAAGEPEGRPCALPCRLAAERRAADALARVAGTAVLPRAAAGRAAAAGTGGCSIAAPGRRRYTPWPARRSGGSETGVAPDGDDSGAEQRGNRSRPPGMRRSWAVSKLKPRVCQRASGLVVPTRGLDAVTEGPLSDVDNPDASASKRGS